MNELKGIYESDFNEIKKYIEKEAAPGTQRDEAIESLRAIYLEAQESGAELSEIRGESPLEYAKEVAECLPKRQKRSVAGMKKIELLVLRFVAAAVVFAVVFGAFWFLTGDEFILKQRGYHFVWSNPKKFMVTTEEIFNSISISGGSSSNLTFEDELYDSYVFVRRDGTAGCTGFIKENGMRIEKFELSKDGKNLVIQMRATDTINGGGNGKIVTPAYPTTVFNKNPVRNLEKEILNDAVESNIFYGSELTVTVEDCVYKSYKISGYITKEGDICFTYTLGLENEKYTAAAKKRIESGKAIPVDFETFYSLEWNYIGFERIRNIKLAAFGNQIFAEDIDIFHEYCEAKKELNGFSLLLGVGIDRENGKILGYKVVGTRDVEKAFSFGVSEVKVEDEGKTISVKLEHTFEQDEYKSEKVVFTLDDFK